MALRMSRIDDLNGDEDAETVTIVVNGRGVELDLGEKSMQKLTKALEPFLAAAPEARYSVTRGGAVKNGTSVKKQRHEEQGFDPALVRAWAADHGIEVPARGRIPAAIAEQYKAAQ